MDRTAASPSIYRFGPFELSVDAAELRKNGIRLKLQDQPFHILCTLIEHSGELVAREQLRQQLWPDGTFVDFEHGLNTAIKKLRDVLNDDADTPRYIETIPRKGYRFIASLNREATQPPQQAFPPQPQRRSRTLLAIAGVALVALAALLVYRLQWRPNPPLVFGTRQLTFTGDLSFWRFYTIQTDGRRVYYSKITERRIYSIPVNGGGESSFATNLREPLLLHVSPDGSNLFVREYLRFFRRH